MAGILYSKQYVTPLISWLAPETGKMKQVLCFDHDRPPARDQPALSRKKRSVSVKHGVGAGPGPGSGSIFLKKYAVLGLGLGLC